MNDTDVTVAMPWRPTPEREPAHQRTRAFWAHAGLPVIEADSNPDQPFNLSAARNNAVRRCTTELIIVADADTIGDLGAIHHALHQLQQHPHQVIWPYQTYRHIPPDWTDQPDLMAAPIDRVYHNSVGGILATTRDTYWQLGGMDEHFRSWGFEDNAFHAAALTLAAVSRLPGIVFSFNHPADRDMSSENPNRYRNELYKFATGHPAIMRELIKR